MRFRAFVRGLRPHQWTKNGLLLVPLALTPSALAVPEHWVVVGWAILAWSLVASAGYLLNDWLDLEADRDDPQRSGRPFASGALPLGAGLAGAAGLLVVGFGVAWQATPAAFLRLLALYLVLTLAYSAFLKRLLLLDVLLLAGLYTLRVLAGGAAVGIAVTPWLLAFSLFLFVGLAFAKRYTELQRVARRAGGSPGRRAYRVEDVELVMTFGVASSYLSALVLGLFVTSEDVGSRYAEVALLWGLVPLLLYWLSRLWFLARRGDLPDDPVAFAVRDPVSWGIGAAMAALVWAAARGF